MKALVLEKYNHLVYRNVPDPRPNQDEVLIRVKSCGICGSDVHGLDGSTGRRIPPLIMGHEAAGEILQIGSEVKNWKRGDRVTFDSTVYPQNDWFTKNGMYNLSDNRQVLGVSCDEFRREGAFAELVVIPQHILYRIPDNVSFNQAAMVEPAAVALHAVRLTPLNERDRVLVIGAGMIGLFVVQMLKSKGCSNIIVADVDPIRLNMALQLGGKRVFNPKQIDIGKEIFDITGNRGVDTAIEAVGINETIKLGMKCVRKGGILTLIGNITPEITLSLQDVVTRQLRLQGSYAICGEYPEVLDLISKGLVNVDVLLSMTAPLSEGAGWFKRLKKKEPGLIKVVLNP